MRPNCTPVIIHGSNFFPFQSSLIQAARYGVHVGRHQLILNGVYKAMIFTTDGTPVQGVSLGCCNMILIVVTGITGGYGGDRRVEYIIPLGDRKKGSYDFVIEQSCNGMFGVPFSGDTIDPPDMNRYYQVRVVAFRQICLSLFPYSSLPQT